MHGSRATIQQGGGVAKPQMSQQKRSRERAKQEKRQQKAQKRAEVKQQRRDDTPGSGAGEDPDIAGIVPGPQPSPWDEE